MAARDSAPPVFKFKDQGSRPGLLLVGHGTRELEGVRQFLELARQMAEQSPEVLLEPCFLELAEPTIPMGLGRLLDRHIDRLIVAPLFLFAAGHAKRDLPRAIAGALQAAGQASLPRQQTPPLELHPELLVLSRLRYEAALPEDRPVPAAETTLVMIGRGSSDTEATGGMQRYAGVHAQRLGVGRFEVGFLAAARPTLAEALSAAAGHLWRRVVVQPHLLFEGSLSAEVREAVAQAQQDWPAREWLVTLPLGPHERLIRAIRSLCGLGEMQASGTLRSASAAVLPDKTVQTTCARD